MNLKLITTILILAGAFYTTGTPINDKAASSSYRQIMNSAPFRPTLPYSVCLDKIPTKNYAAVYVDVAGRVCLKIVGDGVSGSHGNRAIRKQVLDEVVSKYSDITDIKVRFTAKQVEQFLQSGIVGSPLQKLGSNERGMFPGIPYEQDIRNDFKNIDLTLWLKAIRKVIYEKTQGGKVEILVVADANLNFMKLQRIFDNFNKANIFNVSILTSEMEVSIDRTPGSLCTIEYFSNNHSITPLVIFGSTRSPAVVEDHELSFIRNANLKKANNSGKCSMAKAHYTTYSGNTDIDSEEEEQIQIDEPEPEELIDEEDICSTSIFNLQIPRSKAIEFEVGGNFPKNSWGNITTLGDGSSSGQIALIRENNSGRTSISYFRDYNYPFLYDFEKLLPLYYHNRITEGEYLRRTQQLEAEQRENGPEVIIRPTDGATLSTVMAAISIMKISHILKYYVVTGHDDSAALEFM